MKAKKYLLLIIFISSILSAQSKKDYRSLGTGVPVDLATSTNWEYFNGFNWIPANQAPFLVDGVETAKLGNTVYIQVNDTWNCSANVTVPTGANIDFKGITGTGFGIAAGEFKTTFNTPSTIFFSAASGTIPYNSYANITIPAGSSYTYTGGTMLTSWASIVTVDGILTLNSAANYYFTIGTAPLSLTTIGSSYLLGSGIINGSEKIRFGGDATTKPIICNFTGTIGLATTGVLVNGSVQLVSNLTSSGMFYFVNNNIYIDLNGFLLQAKSLNGTASRINFKNTSPGSLTVSTQAAGLGSADGLPFRNITLNSGSTTINSDIIVENLFTNGATLSAISARVIHIPTIHDDLGGTIGTNVTIAKDIVNVTILSETKTPAELGLTASSNLIVASGGVLNVSASAIVNNITIEPGAKVEVISNQLEVNDLTLNAGYSGNLYDGFATSSLKVGGSGIKINGRLRYIRTFDDTQWYFVSFPYDVIVSEITSSASPFVLGTNWFIKYYDGAQRATGSTSGNWKHITEAALLADQTTLHAKRGYIIGISSGTMSLTFPMISNSTIAAEVDKTIDVTYYGSADAGVAESHKGWNLIGQPFLSKFNAGGLSATNLQYLVFSDGGASKTYTVKLPSEVTELNPFVSFFIQAGASLETEKVSFATSARQLVRSPVEIALSDRVKIYFNSATGSDNTNLLMDNNQIPVYQIGQDLEKWIGTGTAKPQIYSILGGLNYVYNGLPMSSVNNLPVGIYTQTAGNTTISVDATRAITLSKLLLTDNGVSPATITDLLVSNYTFTAAAGTDNSRFAITAQRITTDNNLIGNQKGEVGVLIVNGKLSMVNISPSTKVRVYDALGRMIFSKNATSNSMEVKLGEKGIYTVQLQNGTTISTRKVIF